MSTIALASGTVTGKGLAALYGKPAKQLYKLVNLVDAATVKGSALAATDIITTVRVPKYSTLIAPRVCVLEVADCATLHADVGVAVSTTLVTNNIIDEGDLTALGPLTNAGGTALVTFLEIGTAADLSVTLMTFSGTAPTTGVFAVTAIVLDMSQFEGANIASQNS
jgi:hypothetical protein